MTPEHLREIERLFAESDGRDYDVSLAKAAAHPLGVSGEAVEGWRRRARAIAPLIEAARADGQKDMQERCRQVVKTCSVQYAPQNCSGRIERQIDNCREDIEASIAAIPIDGANQIQSSDGSVEAGRHSD